MKGSLLLMFLLSIGFLTQAQQPENSASTTKITGRVIDSSSNAPLDYATITLFLKGAKIPSNGTTTNNSGNFTVDNVAAGNYKVVVEFIGYKPHTFANIVVEKDKPVDLKEIVLAKKQETMQAVVVTAQAKLVDNKIDKMVFNAEKDITSQTGVATDVLKKVPQVSVDIDGNVELAGSSSIRFLINGKPSSAFGSSITDVLQAIPASQIKSIEVITNPGAKYDAQGLGGIINIILKKSTARGVNGNLSLTGGTRMENGSFNFNARKGKFGFNAFLSGNTRPRSNTYYNSDRNSTDSAGTMVLLHQDGDGRYKRGGYQTGMGFDYTVDDKSSITGSLAYNHFGNNGSGLTNQLQQITAVNGNILSRILSANQTGNVFSFHNVDASLNYKKTFAKEDQELDIEANSSFGTNNSSNNNNQYLMPQDSLYYGTNSKNPGKEKETEVKIDYAQPLKKDVLLGIGSKLNARYITSAADVLMYQPASKTFLTDNYLSNSLNYHQKVYAFYSELSFPVSTLFNAKLGGRYERTEINSYFSNAQHQEAIPGYNTFVPSVFLSKKLGDDQMLKLSYSKRIERPDYRDLNPFINTSDPKNISAGNPYLQPEVGNRYELGYSHNFNQTGFFMVNLFYRTSNHDIQSYITYYPTFKVGDSTYTNVSVSTRENIGLEKNMGVNLFGDLHFTTKFNVRANFFIFRRHTINALDPGYNSNSFNYRTNMNASYQFTKTLVAEFFGNFNSARHEVQGTYPSFTTYSLAIRKQFWNKKGSLALTAVNPFNEYVNMRSALYGPNFTVNSIRKVPFRSIGINFTWKFGKLEFKQQKEESNMNLSPSAEQ